MLDTRKSIALAVAVQAVVICATLWLYGAGSLGAEIAARNTARTASIFFALALALRSRGPEGNSAAYGFVVAHAMHFMSVAFFGWISPKAPLHELSIRSAISVTAGLTILGTLAFTISAQRRWQKKLNAVAFFLFGLVFTFATLYNGIGGRNGRLWGSVVPLPFLLAAMVWRLRSRQEPQAARAASAV